MTIEEYRFILIEDKIITRADVQKLANELYSLYKQKGRAKNKSISFQVYCSEKVRFRSSNPSIFDTDSPISSKRVWKIVMDYAFEEAEHIRIELEHDPERSYDNSIEVEGMDSNWVNGTLKRLEEIIESFSPQNTFIRRYYHYLYSLFSLTFGLAIINLGAVLADLFPPAVPPSEEVISVLSALVQWFMSAGIYALTLLIVLKYSLAGLFGLLPARYLMRWLGRLYPDVELQLAPEHKMDERRLRLQLANLVSVSGIVTLLVQVAVDFIKGLV